MLVLMRDTPERFLPSINSKHLSQVIENKDHHNQDAISGLPSSAFRPDRLI